MMSSGLIQLGFRDNKFITESLRDRLGPWSLKDVVFSRQGEFNDTIELHCGKCRLLPFWSLTRMDFKSASAALIWTILFICLSQVPHLNEAQY